MYYIMRFTNDIAPLISILKHNDDDNYPEHALEDSFSSILYKETKEAKKKLFFFARIEKLSR